MGPVLLPVASFGSSSRAGRAFLTVQRLLLAVPATRRCWTTGVSDSSSTSSLAGTQPRKFPLLVQRRPAARGRSHATSSGRSNRAGRGQMPLNAAAVGRRHFSSSDSRDEMHHYLDLQGIPGHSRDGVLRALRAAYGRKPALSDLQSLGPQGLRELAAAVVQEQIQEQQHLQYGSRRPFVRLRVSIPHHKTVHDKLVWKWNESLLDVTKNYPDLLGEYVEGTCGGQMSCCTCHVYVSPKLMLLLEQHGGGVSEPEQDMLDLAYDGRPDRSRLGCQVVLTEQVFKAIQEVQEGEGGDRHDSSHGHDRAPTSDDGDGDGDDQDRLLTVTIPSGVNNVWK